MFCSQNTAVSASIHSPGPAGLSLHILSLWDSGRLAHHELPSVGDLSFYLESGTRRFQAPCSGSHASSQCGCRQTACGPLGNSSLLWGLFAPSMGHPAILFLGGCIRIRAVLGFLIPFWRTLIFMTSSPVMINTFTSKTALLWCEACLLELSLNSPLSQV